MYNLRTPLLDLPITLKNKILDAITNNELTPTGMDDQSKYGSLKGFLFSDNIEKEICNYSKYKEFFSLVPDKFKLTLVIATSTKNFPVHSDHLKKSSLTCLLTGTKSEIAWYAPATDEVRDELVVKNSQPTIYHRKLTTEVKVLQDQNKLIKASSIILNAGESILFNNNAYHGVIGENIKLILLQFGFLNIHQVELEQIYNKWKITEENQKC